MKKTVEHRDLIDDFEFMFWCDRNYENSAVVKWRYAYIIYVRDGRSPRAAALKMSICKDTVYRRVRKYEAAARKYKAEQSA